MSENYRNLLGVVWGSEEEAGLIDMAGRHQDLGEIQIIEIAHVPVEGRGGRPIDGNGFLSLINLDFGNASAEEKAPSGWGFGKIEDGGEVEGIPEGGANLKRRSSMVLADFQPTRGSPIPSSVNRGPMSLILTLEAGTRASRSSRVSPVPRV